MGKEFFKRLEKYIPKNKKYLNKGASKKELLKLERETGYPFPESFKATYSIHNGEKKLGLMFGLTWYSIEEILSAWKGYKNYYEESVTDVISFEKNKVQEAYYHSGWIPIAYDYGGNYLAMDFAPGENGKAGQIINFGRDERQMFVISESFDALLELLIQQFENGNCSLITEEDGNPYVIWGDYGHFFDNLIELQKTPCAGEDVPLELDESWTIFLTQMLGKTPSKIHELQNIITLRLFPSNITNLKPLAYFQNVRELIASGLEITDFTPIAEMQDLKKLYLAKTSLQHLDFLKPLKDLKQLSIGNTKVRDISVLKELPLLQELSLENLVIDDLSPLASCKKLSHLNLSGIQTADLHGIKDIFSLRELDITGVKMSNLDDLKGMMNLQDIRFEEVENYSALQELDNLQSLTCPFNAFIATKDLFDKKMNYTIMGEINDEQDEIYTNYVMEG